MEIVSPNTILTIEEAAHLIKLKDSSLLMKAISKGILPCIQIESERRIIGKDFNDFLARNRTATGPNGNTTTKGGQSLTGNSRWVNLKISSGQPFSHIWPDYTKEKFRDVFEGSVQTSNRFYSMKIGFTKRKSSGKLRERAVVFIDNRPIREFCGADDFDKTKMMVCVVKNQGKQVKEISKLPQSYDNFKVEPYNKLITGPYASTNLAVTCRKKDIETMVEIALIRMKELEK